jgi:hypothetical protein
MASSFAGDEELSLFNSKGEPVAYIAPSEEMTIYLWDGKPVAYLDDEANVYGFNGKHLGWFVNGAIFNHQGVAECATKVRFAGYTEYEPYKSYKEYRPYRSYKEYAPYQPYLTNSFSQIPCSLFLAAGASN